MKLKPRTSTYYPVTVYCHCLLPWIKDSLSVTNYLNLQTGLYLFHLNFSVHSWKVFVNVNQET